MIWLLTYEFVLLVLLKSLHLFVLFGDSLLIVLELLDQVFLVAALDLECVDDLLEQCHVHQALVTVLNQLPSN